MAQHRDDPTLLAIRNLASVLVQRQSWQRLAGVTHDGARDLYDALGYKRDLTTADYRARYERGGIAARIVEVFPQATWRGEGELVEDENPEKTTAFEKTWDALNKRLNIWATFCRADILAGLGRYSIILIGAPGELNQPLTKLKPEQLMYLATFSEEDAQVNTWVQDSQDPRFGLPETYTISRITPNPNFKVQRVVHWSRVIHIADGLLDDFVYGQPRLRRIWNDLDNLDKVVGGGSEAFWKRADQGMQVDIDPDVKFTPEDLTSLQTEIDEYVHNLRRIVRTRGVSMNPLGSDVANFAAPAAGVIEQISAATGIPQRILMGSERGELASTQDKLNWNDLISDRRQSFAEPMVVRPFVDRLVEFGVLPEPEEYDVRWPQVKFMTDAEKAAVATQWAGLNAATGETVVLPTEIRDRVLELPPFTEEQLAEIEQKKAEQQAQAEAEAAKQQEVELAKAEAMGKAAPEEGEEGEGPIPTKGKPVPKKGTPAEEEEEEEAPKAKAAARAMMVAALTGREAANTPQLRDALERGDQAVVRVLLKHASDVVEQTLRANTPALLED
jgi:hypothetical protein